MQNKCLLKIVYFRTIICLLIIITLTVFKFLVNDKYKIFYSYYKTNFLDDINIEQVISDEENEKEETTQNEEKTVHTSVNDTALKQLSTNIVAENMCIPVDYQRNSSEYGYRYNPVTGNYALHSGIDFAAPEGQEIYAAADGIVNKAMFSTDLGYFVQINHSSGLYSTYAHCLELKVEQGDKVKKGDLIALVGSTGQSTGPHLHFEIKLNDTILNPIYYLPISNNS